MLTLEHLHERRDQVLREREEHARTAREHDMGFAYVLGELEHLIAEVEQREAAESAPIEPTA